jgi:hypothetical protein
MEIAAAYLCKGIDRCLESKARQDGSYTRQPHLSCYSFSYKRFALIASATRRRLCSATPPFGRSASDIGVTIKLIHRLYQATDGCQGDSKHYLEAVTLLTDLECTVIPLEIFSGW